MPTILCAICTDQLILAYKFFKKVQQADERFISLNDMHLELVQSGYVEEGGLEGTNETRDEQLVLVLEEEYNKDVSLLNINTDQSNNEIEEIYVNDEYQFNMLFENAIKGADTPENVEVLDQLNTETVKISNDLVKRNVEKHFDINNKMVNIKNKNSNIVVTKNVASILQKAGEINTTLAISTLNNNNKRESQLNDEKNKYVKKSKITLDLNENPNLLHIAIPQFSISNQRSNENGIKDAAYDVTAGSSSSTIIKTLDVSAVRLSTDSLISFDPNDTPEENSETSMYMCKYCPKAYSTYIISFNNSYQKKSCMSILLGRFC